MNPNELLRIVDSLHREKNIDPEIVFQAIEAALVSAAKRQYGEESDIQVNIVRKDGAIQANCDGQFLDPEEMIGRIGAQTAKQVIIQKIREAERDSLMAKFEDQVDDLVSGQVQRSEGGATTVSVDGVEAILPKSQQLPGESHMTNERVRAVIHEVVSQGNRVKVILSRTRAKFVERLFEQEIPEIAEGVISINALSREPGYRSKVAVSSVDQRVDCVGACVGVRGNRIKNIVDELPGERIDIVRWSDDPEMLIPNSLQPAEVEQVLLCDMIGRAIVLVREDQLSLAIGKKGQNVRLASKLCGWDIEIMTGEELEEQIERAVGGFSALDGVSEELAQALVEQGYLSYDDLSVIEPDDLISLGGLTEEQVDVIVGQAEEKAEEAEQAAADARRRQREQQRQDALAASQAEAQLAAQPAEDTDRKSDTGDAGESSPSTESESVTPADNESADTESADTETSDAESADTESSDAESSDAESADTESAGAESSDAEPAVVEESAVVADGPAEASIDEAGETAGDSGS